MDRINDSARQVVDNTMGLQYLDTLRPIGQSPSTKRVMPVERTSIARSIGGYLTGLTGVHGAQGRPNGAPHGADNASSPSGPVAVSEPTQPDAE